MREAKGRTGLLPFLVALCFVVILCFAPSAMAQGGPPMLTDDPGTPGNGRWEVNFLSTLDRSRGGWVFEAPNVDINYGLGEHLQLKFETPWVVMKNSSEQMKNGPGNSMVGVKWRFLDEERNGVDVSTYPQFEFNNRAGSVERGLVERGLHLFLPIEAVKKVGPVKVNAEIGYEIVEHGPDELEYGLAVGRGVTRRIELIGELHGSALRTLREGELSVNAGSRLRLNRNAGLLFSAGRTIRTPAGEGPHYLAAVGLQLNFSNRVFNALKRK